MVSRMRVGVQSNFEWIGLWMAMNRSMLTREDQMVERRREEQHRREISPAISVKIDTATEVPRTGIGPEEMKVPNREDKLLNFVSSLINISSNMCLIYPERNSCHHFSPFACREQEEDR